MSSTPHSSGHSSGHSSSHSAGHSSGHSAGSPAALPNREDWKAACQFHDLASSQVLAEVSRRVQELKSRALGRESHPLVLLDLDSTLYEVEPRSERILAEWRESSESAQFPHVRQRLAELSRQHLGYSIQDTFTALGLSIELEEIRGAWASAKAFWRERFFTNEYLRYDLPYDGAAAFTRELHSLGAEIVYLTGRDEPGMGEGTRANLIRDGFAWGAPSIHLLLKPRFEMDDLAHKMAAADYIRSHGTLVASFENEPPNLVALYELFPEAMHVFVETICSDRPARPSRGLYRIQSFTRE